MSFSFNKKDRAELTKPEMETFLIILKGFLKIGFSPLEAIKTLSENEPEGKKKNVIAGIEYETHELNRPLQNVLLSKKLISPLEHTIMSKSNSMISSIDTILDMRRNGKKFEKAMLAIIAFPLIMILATLAFISFGGPGIMDFINFLLKMSEMATGSPAKADLPFFLIYMGEIKIFFFVLIALIVGLIYTYYWNYTNDTKKIYKIFPLKVYDDAPILFQMMYNLKKTGMPAGDLFQEMIKNAEPEPLREMFQDIQKKVEQNRPFYTVFEQYGFPKNITSIIEVGEKTYTIWDNLPDLVEFCKITGDNGINRVKLGLGIPLKYGGQAVLIFTLLTTFLTVMMTATSLMG